MNYTDNSTVFIRHVEIARIPKKDIEILVIATVANRLHELIFAKVSLFYKKRNGKIKFLTTFYDLDSDFEMILFKIDYAIEESNSFFFLHIFKKIMKQIAKFETDEFFKNEKMEIDFFNHEKKRKGTFRDLIDEIEEEHYKTLMYYFNKVLDKSNKK